MSNFDPRLGQAGLAPQGQPSQGQPPHGRHAQGQLPNGQGGMPLGPQFIEPLPEKRSAVMTVTTIVIMAVAVLLTLVVVGLAVLQSGVTLVGVSLSLALVTLTFVWFVVWFIDRWEPEPKLLLFGAVLWGAGISTSAALIVGLVGDLLVPGLPEWWGAVVQAPVVEEFFKGLGVLVIFFIARKHFNGPTDGIVFGALSGAGFAFTENILYFSSMAAQGGAIALGFQVLVRGLALPLLHPICTSLTGAAIGWGARRGGIGSAIGGFFLGLVPAIAIHAIWNGGSTLGSVLAGNDVGAVLRNMLLLFLVVMVPIFIGWIVLVARLRRRDRELVRLRLGEYASVGWYSPAEVQMLSTMQGRSGARAWARRLGPGATRAMKAFIEGSTRLAHVRHHVVLDPGNGSKQRDEHELLSDLTRIRRVLNQSQQAGSQMMRPAAPVPAPQHMPARMPQPHYAAPQGHGYQSQQGQQPWPQQAQRPQHGAAPQQPWQQPQQYPQQPQRAQPHPQQPQRWQPPHGSGPRA